MVSISWVVEHQNAIIPVSDQGKGFPAKVREFLFEPFVRGDEREIPGSGLGLSIARRLAEAQVKWEAAHGSALSTG